MSSKEIRFLISQPWRIVYGNFYQRPVTCSLILLVGLYCLWMGITLVVVDIPPGRLPAYRGVRIFFELHSWGYAYLVAGGLTCLRLLVMQNAAVDMICYVLSMLVLLAWALGFMIGPYSVGQPAFVFVFLICAFTPFVRGIVLNWKDRQVS